MKHRIAIIGGPRHGKSTLAAKLSEEMDIPIFCGDHLSKVVNPKPGVTYLPEDVVWKGAHSWIATNWLSMLPDPWIVEGVLVAAALRELLRSGHSRLLLVDKIYVIPFPHHPQTPGQQICSKGIMTVWSQIAREYCSIAEYVQVK